ncbi:MAG: hypothetical protein AUJ23_01170 [Candidatus Magasanikbacteria bacterium CG1_02_32_51]|uniref:Glycosyltransferase 2-like domain-containing protein n=1 Tax=Candidatus Magasanikbacteria bacterium CG1_02_32_51 TaxID=1805238 RepID=A0A1J4U5W9_9BACT|nr:MAG: hypothetical protein AUJ23_01170 [Candidatus Magasanikbacteria bacterium CG1_02_32_51]
MFNKLSIIIPCYNSEKTLSEAVSSIYRQNILIDFEIILVDDYSLDRTKKIMVELSDRYYQIKCFFHEKNLGGGAARNTGVKFSDGDCIFCLDSDDVLGDNSLSRMISFLDEKKCDGVLFEKNIYFKRKINNVISVVNNKFSNKAVIIDDLFDEKKTFLTLVNFLYTRKAYLEVGGYPEHHDFDTQHFGYKFLSKDLEAFVCQGAIYYQRINNYKSYFQRVYEKGEMSLNMYYIYEDIIDRFSSGVISEIYDYDIFGKNKLCVDELGAHINALYLNNKLNFFKRKNGTYVDRNEWTDLFVQAIKSYKEGKYAESIDIYKKIAFLHGCGKIMVMNLVRNYLALSNIYDINVVEKVAIKTLEEMKIKKQKIKNLYPFLVKIFNFFKKYYDK